MYILQNFFSQSQHDRLLQFAIDNEPNFVPTTTSSGEADYRSSIVLYDLAQWQQTIAENIEAILPDVFEESAIDSFNPSQIEMQLTAHRDGGFYKWHSDNGSIDVQSRVLTYVYYFWCEPKMFDGGDLEFEYETIAPMNNAIVFFPSEWQHQVSPVKMSENEFRFCRFTVNGWLRC